jgi:hypothetical protein
MPCIKKSIEQGKFEIKKFPIKIARLVTHMLDKMVTMIIIEKDSMVGPISKGNQPNLNGSSIHVPKKQKKKKTLRRKERRLLMT